MSTHRGFEKEAAESRYVVGRKSKFLEWLRRNDEYEYAFDKFFKDRMRSSIRITIQNTADADDDHCCLWIKGTALIYRLTFYNTNTQTIMYDDMKDIPLQATHYATKDWAGAQAFAQNYDIYAAPVYVLWGTAGDALNTWARQYCIKKQRWSDCEVVSGGEFHFTRTGVKEICRAYFEKEQLPPMKAEFYWDFLEDTKTPEQANIDPNVDVLDPNLDLFGFKLAEGWDYTQIYGLFVAKPLKSHVDKEATGKVWNQIPQLRGRLLMCYYTALGQMTYFIMPTFGKTQYKVTPYLGPENMSYGTRQKIKNICRYTHPIGSYIWNTSYENPQNVSAEITNMLFFSELPKRHQTDLLGLTDNYLLNTGNPISQIISLFAEFSLNVTPDNTAGMFI